MRCSKCWESIFRFIFNNGDNYNIYHYFNFLSFVSKQFLSINNYLLFSLTIYIQGRHFLGLIFNEFTNLNLLNLKQTGNYDLDLNDLLHQILNFALKKLTSLNISNQWTFPANGLLVLSKKITTLTSLNCSNMFLDNNKLLFVVGCFPLLKELNLSHTLVNYHSNVFN